MESSNERIEEGPWPEPDETDTLVDAQAAARKRGPDVDAAWSEPSELSEPSRPAGSKGVALAVAGLNVVFLMMLAAMLVVGIYTFITIYAIVKARRSGPDTADPAIILLGVVGLVTLFVVLLGVGGWAIGRTADPKKRR